MKKSFAILAFLFAITISATAQDTKPNAATSTKNDLIELNSYLHLDENTQKEVNNTIYRKNKILAQSKITESDKNAIITETQAALAKQLSPEQLQKLKLNPELYRRLTQEIK